MFSNSRFVFMFSNSISLNVINKGSINNNLLVNNSVDNNSIVIRLCNKKLFLFR